MFLNSLSDALFNDLIHVSIAFDSMDEIGAIVVTGKGKAFAGKVVEDREGLVDEAIRYAIAKLNYAIRSTPTTVNW